MARRDAIVDSLQMHKPLVIAACTLLAGCASASAGIRVRGLAPSTASPQVIQRQPPPGTCHYRGQGVLARPDPRCTPGAVDPTVTQSDIHRTICRAGYTEGVRPPEPVSEPEKLASLRAYGGHRPPRAYEYDHLVALELGGARNSSGNLWPELGSDPNPKDALEDRLRERVCAGEMTLAAAQLAIASDWVAAYRRYG